jgi:hypothetical protein
MVKSGDHVSWNRGSGKGHGTVKSVKAEKVTKTIGGKTVTRNGTRDNPALTIDSDHGHDVLKRESEVKKAT